ncbi:MAG: hypothetical protein ACKVZJ_06700 [Phycisphaerales bacterium]
MTTHENRHGYLFPGEARLDLPGRVALGGLAATGLAAVALVVFLLVLEAHTTPSAGKWGTATIVSSCMLGLHFVVESRASGPLSVPRWIIFAACILEVSIAPWFVIRDLTAQAVFSLIGLVGGVNLLGARLLTAWTPAFLRWHLAWRIVFSALAWLVPFGVCTALLIARRVADRASFGEEPSH